MIFTKLTLNPVGTFRVTSGALKVSDPCYGNGVRCAADIQNVANGKWEAYSVTGRFNDWGLRVAELIAIIGGLQDPECLVFTKTNDDIGVDSGQCGIYDKMVWDDGADVERDYDNKEGFYGKVCDITLDSPHLAGIINDFGVVSSSGFGDGGYNLYTASRDGKVIAVKVVYIDEVAEHEEAEELARLEEEAAEAEEDSDE